MSKELVPRSYHDKEINKCHQIMDQSNALLREVGKSYLKEKTKTKIMGEKITELSNELKTAKGQIITPTSSVPKPLVKKSDQNMDDFLLKWLDISDEEIRANQEKINNEIKKLME